MLLNESKTGRSFIFSHYQDRDTILFIHIICAVGIWCLSLPTSTINSDTPTAMIYTTKAEMTMISHYHNYFSSPSTLTHPLRYLKYRTVTINENGFHAKTRFAISISLNCLSLFCNLLAIPHPM